MNLSNRLFGFILILFLVAWCLVPAGPSGAREKTGLDAESLLQVLTAGAASLEKGIAEARKDADRVQRQVERAEANLQDLRAQIATLKASQAAGDLQLNQAQEVLRTFSDRQKQVEARLQEVRKQRDKLAKQLATRINAFHGFRQEVERLQATDHPAWESEEVQKAYDRYQRLINRYQTSVTQILKLWDQVILNVQEEQQTLNEATEALNTYIEVDWKEELLKRQGPVPLVKTVNQIWQTLVELPTRLTHYLSHPQLLQRIADSLRARWAQFLGLLVLLLVLVWLVPRVRQMILPGLQQWQTEAADLSVKIILKAGEIILRHLLSLSFLAWLALIFWFMGLWVKEAVRILYLGLAIWVGLRLAFDLLQAVFAGQAEGGLLPLDRATARFYRRHLKLLLAYVLVLEIFGLKLFDFLELESARYINLEALLQFVFMVWVLWILRPKYLEDLRDELSESAWTKLRIFFFVVRTLVGLVLGAILVTTLLGFTTLSAYIAKGAGLTGLLLILFWVTWQASRTVLDYALHPQKKRVPGELWEQEELLIKYSLAIVKVVATIIVAGAFLLVLKLWGIDLVFLQWLYAGLTWGPKLGPFTLDLLSLGLVVLTLYLGRWFSRFLRTLLEVRFYPRTDWDESVRYSISNTFHYTLQALAILIALGFLGVSFGDLAIVAAGLGVGIGFGLQNIVNNFISGLILLFERPIKVGDMLIIDGQWGAVKEIRVRSTIFQTYDRYVLIIPNSELISTKVLNWTYYGPGVNRLTLKIGVSYGSDVHQVTKLLEEVCQANPRVLDDPTPLIYFEAYGDSSLNFNIWAFVRSPADRIATTHELNSAIFETFNEHGIEIPFPQRDLYVKSWPEPPSPRVEGLESEDEADSSPEQSSDSGNQRPKR
ncbi:MAG: mechanosensitive ion channel domain-containing protein [Thermodesulfobacteriota bacterium]